MTVVAAGELDHLVSAGRRSRDPDRAHRRLGAGVDEPHALDGRHEATDQPAELDLLRGRRAEAGASCSRTLERASQAAWRVTVDERAPRHDVIDIRAPVDVSEPRAAGAVDERWIASDGAERANGAVDAARQHAAGAGEQTRRLRAWHRVSSVGYRSRSSGGALHGPSLIKRGQATGCKRTGCSEDIMSPSDAARGEDRPRGCGRSGTNE